jgi:hypothetical protein
MSEAELTAVAGDGHRTQGNALSTIRRVRRIVLESARDCRCRERVAEAINGLEDFEQRRERKRLTEAARIQRRKIAALLELLADFDPATADEGELSEASLLLDDIASEARLGSSLLHELAGLRETSAPAPRGAPR